MESMSMTSRSTTLLSFVAIFLLVCTLARCAPCTTSCETCVAKEDAEDCCGILDKHCAKCADGYRWWPCGSDFIGQCLCVSSGREDEPSALPLSSSSLVDEAEEMAAADVGEDTMPSNVFATETPSTSQQAMEPAPSSDLPFLLPTETAAVPPESTEDTPSLAETITMQAQGEDQAERSGSRCNAQCETCVAKEGAGDTYGILDSHCAKCADGYEWWPCGNDYIDQCLCGEGSGLSSSDDMATPAATSQAAMEVYPAAVMEQPLVVTGYTAQADTTSYQVGNFGSCGTEITQELLDGPHPPAACKTCTCGSCYRVTLNGRSQKVKVVDLTGTTTFEIAAMGPPGPQRGSEAWGDLCPRCTHENRCADEGPFNGAYCNAQPITYTEVPC